MFSIRSFSIKLITTLNMIFNVTSYSELHIPESFMINLEFYRVNVNILVSKQPIWPLLVKNEIYDI
jgi:hypothetical protein